MGMLKFRWGYVAPVLLSRVLLATMPVQETERKRRYERRRREGGETHLYPGGPRPVGRGGGAECPS